MNIVKANIEDSIILTDITFLSKAYWGYSAKQMEIWRPQLVLTEDYILKNNVFCLHIKEEIIGYFSWFEKDELTAKLDNLFLLPNYIGMGYGRCLMNTFMRQTKLQGYKILELDADPNTTKFYAKFGFKIIGQLKTSTKDRYLPIMQLNL